MKRSIKQSSYVRRGALILAAVAGTNALSASAFGIARDWMTSSGMWNTSGNWSPSGAPGGLDSALIGSTAAAQNGMVTLNTNTTIAALTMTDGMTLDTNSFWMHVGTTTSLSGSNTVGANTFATTLRVENGAGSHDFRTDDLFVTNNARVDLVGGVMRVDGFALFDGTTRLAGDGVVNLYGTGSSSIQMDGVLAPGLGGMTINQVGTAPIDLDGGIGGDRTIAVNTAAANGSAFSSLNVNGTALLDVFDDSIAIGANNVVNMNLTNGWALGSGAKITFTNSLLFPGVAKLNGSTVTINGDLELGANAHAQINAQAIINPTMSTSVPTNGTLEFNSHTTVNGGSFNVAEDAFVRFDGETQIKGGTFTTFSDNPFDGTVIFQGDTRFSGVSTFNGSASARGNMSVGSSGATINADRLDMDGPAGAVWTLYGQLGVNADAIDTDPENTFNGTIVVAPQGILDTAGITVNLPAGQSWKSSGTLVLNGPSFGLTGNAINGSPIHLAGVATVNSANAITARAHFEASGTTSISNLSYLVLDGGTMADPNVMNGGVINGPGTLVLDGAKMLEGYGTINAAIDLRNGAELRAKGSKLALNGNAIVGGTIGTSDISGALDFLSSWSMNGTDKLDLRGGVVDGAAIANQGLVSGNGIFKNYSLTNNKTIAASNGTLTIDTNSTFDMDGVLGGVPVVNAVAGNFHVKTQLDDAFDGIANVGFGRTIRFDQGWTLGAGGTLNLNGSFAQPAVVDGDGFHIVFGRVNVSNNAQLNQTTGFLSGSSVSLPNAMDRLTINDGAVIDPASTIFGAGQLYNAPGSTLHQGNNAFIGVFVNNAGRLVPAGDGTIGLTTIKTFANLDGGTYAADIGGPNAGSSFDRLNVVTGASVDGTLELNQRGGYIPAYGVKHALIHSNGNGLSGTFDLVQNVAITPTKFWAVTYGANDVFAQAALPGDANLDGSVNINDFAIMASNFNTAGSWVDGSFDGNALINISDFALLAGNFNVSVPADLPRGGAVPEPGVASLLATSLLAATRRRRGQA